MAEDIELPVELVDLAWASNRARMEATAGEYSPEAWAPWISAAEAFQRAVTAHAEATEQSRYEVEMAAKRRALEPPKAKDSEA